VPQPWQEWSARGEPGSGGPSRLAHIASAVWQHLPLAVANRLGPPLAARLPWW
jgi:hypothetical protein